MDVIKNKQIPRQLVLLAHGSRDSNWCNTFENGLEVINSYIPHGACLAYMEMAAPSLESVIATHYFGGVRKFDVLPLFFAAGRHLLHDVPAKIEKMKKSHEDLEIHLLDAVGQQNEFWQALGSMITNEYKENAAPRQEHR